MIVKKAQDLSCPARVLCRSPCEWIMLQGAEIGVVFFGKL